MKKALQETDSVALTTDIWTSVATEAYTGGGDVPLSEEWENGRHSAATIAEGTEEVIAKFNIPLEKIKAVVHDNGANVVAAAKILHEKHGWALEKCAGHTLNLVVQNSPTGYLQVCSCCKNPC